VIQKNREGILGAHREKRDRTARLLKIQVLLGQNPYGLKVEEIARRCSTSIRTVYRDLNALELELDVPIWQEGNKRGVVDGFHLPPVPFTIPEAMNISLAARLMQSHSRWYDPHRASALIKLKSVLPPPLRKQIENTIEWMEKQPRNERQIAISEKLANAWISQHQVAIRYREKSEGESQEFMIEPYFIEPATPGNFGFVIAYCLSKNSISVFDIGYIESVRFKPERYTIPENFDVVPYLNPAWGAITDGPVQAVKLHFRPHRSRPIVAVVWDTSQVIEPQPDGSLIIAAKVVITSDFRSWVLGWGNEVEVIEPEKLRSEIIGMNESVRNMYLGNSGATNI
jgi:predicted DNA-binding transcriptional regulator YafY